MKRRSTKDLENTIETLKKEVEQLTHTVNAITQVNEDLSELVQVQRLTRPVYIQ